VVVASIQMKNLKIEAEKGFRRTLFEPELVDPNVEINFVKDSEGQPMARSTLQSQFTEREII
jgi:hypothetical protein